MELIAAVVRFRQNFQGPLGLVAEAYNACGSDPKIMQVRKW